MEKPNFEKEIRNDIQDLKKMSYEAGFDLDKEVLRYEKVNDDMHRTLMGHGQAILDKINAHFLKTGELSADLNVLREEVKGIVTDLSQMGSNEPPNIKHKPNPSPGYDESSDEIDTFSDEFELFLWEMWPHLKELLPNRVLWSHEFAGHLVSVDKSLAAGLDLETIKKVMKGGKIRMVWYRPERLNGKLYMIAQSARGLYENDDKSNAVILNSNPAKAAQQLAEFLK